jgi:hypothetical protein
MQANQEYSEKFENLTESLTNTIQTRLIQDDSNELVDVKTAYLVQTRSQEDDKYTDVFEDGNTDEEKTVLMDYKSINYTETFEKNDSDESFMSRLITDVSKSKTNIRSRQPLFKLTIKEDDELNGHDLNYSDTFDSITNMPGEDIHKQTAMAIESFSFLSSALKKKLIDLNANDESTSINDHVIKHKYKIQSKIVDPCAVLEELKRRIENKSGKRGNNSLFPNVKIKDDIFDRLKSNNFLDDLRMDYDEKIKHFGDGLINECFPNNSKYLSPESLNACKHSDYFKFKCDYLKLKLKTL